MKLRRGIMQVVIANIMNLIIAVGNGFLLPKFLSIESYAALKTFLFYLSYAGVLHFGYVDGVFIKYGGKTRTEINETELACGKRVLVVFQAFITLPILLIAGVCRDANLLCAACGVLPINMGYYFKFLYQATGDFKEYRHISNLSALLIFACNMFLLFIIKTDVPLYYAWLQILVYVAVWLFYEGKNRSCGIRVKMTGKAFKTRLMEHIRPGMIVMLGNFMGMWITGIDRWFVKIYHGAADFACYSFAVTMLRFINVVATAFSTTLYHFFCRETEAEEIVRLRKIVLAAGAAAIAAIFPTEYMIRSFLEEYIEAVSIIRVLFAAQFVLIEVNAVYLNLYKALNLQKKYLAKMTIVTAAALFLNGVLGFFWNRIIAYAAATLLTALVWLILCQMDLPEYKMSYAEWAYLLLTIAVYYFCSSFPTLIGILVYVSWVAAAALFFVR